MATRPEIERNPSPRLKSAKSRAAKSMERILSLESQSYQRKSPSASAPASGARPGGQPRQKGQLTGSHKDFELVEGREDDIMGLLKGRVPKQKKAQDNVQKNKMGRSDSRDADLTIPITREKRQATPDGRTSFHFSHDAVSKVNKRTVGEDGRVNQPFAAKAHNKYIERTEAVAIDEEMRLEGLRASLEGADAPGDPNAPAMAPMGLAAAQGAYVERQEALAIQPNGGRVLFTNIDDDAEKRAEYWQLVENHERDAEPDKITFRIASHPEFWASVIKCPDCPDEIRVAYEMADHKIPVTIKTENNIDVREFLAAQPGFIPVPKMEAGEDKNVYAKRCEPAHDMVKFLDGRGGRIQYRIIGELPHELSVAGRAAILRDFAQEFEKRKLPYVAVMHAPDHTNNDKNWHFHLVYHDRPATRVTQAMIDDYKLTKGRQTEKLTVGAWDFTVEDREHDKKNWNNRKIFPFRQDKVFDVTQTEKKIVIDKDGIEKKTTVKANSWVADLRNRLAEITNDHLERGAVERRVDPRRHEEMGIHSDPQEHLGTKLANMEAMGIATPTGVSNEERQWKAILERLDSDLLRRKNADDKEAERLLGRIDKSQLSVDDKKEARRDVTRWHQAHGEAQEHDAIAERLIEHMDRATSRARKVAQMAFKNLSAIDAGKTTKYQKTRRDQLKQKHDEATHYLKLLHKSFADERRLVADSKDAAIEHHKIAAEIVKRLSAQLDAGLVIDPTQTAKPAKGVANDNVAGQQDARKAGNDTPFTKALNRANMDAWIESIRQKRRRLVVSGRRIVPQVLVEGDRAVLDAQNYAAMGGRLRGIKEQQDKIIGELVAHIAGDPASVRTATATANGKVGFFLSVGRPQWVEAFSDYQNDPVLVQARDVAVSRSNKLGINIEGERVRRVKEDQVVKAADVIDVVAPVITQIMPPVVKPEVGIPINAKVPAALAPKPAQPANDRASIDALLGLVKDAPVRVLVANGQASLPVFERNVADALANVDLRDLQVQRRLLALASVQDREIRRLTAYAKIHPNRIEIKDGAPILSTTSPKDLVEFAQRWSTDAGVSLSLTRMRDEHLAKTARIEATDLFRPVAPAAAPEPVKAEPAKPTIEPAPERQDGLQKETDAKPATIEVVKVEGPNVEAPKVEPKIDVVEVSKIDPVSAPTPIVAPAPIVTNDTEIARTPQILPPQTELVLTPVEQPLTKPKPKLRTIGEPTSLIAKAQASADAKRMRDAENERLRAEGKFILEPAAERASRNKSSQIDTWLDAARYDNDRDARQAAALRVVESMEARQELRNIDRAVARRIRDDAEQARAEQQLGLGLGPSKGK